MRVCARCVMDSSDPQIVFDEQGICNHCTRYYEMVKQHVFTGSEGRAKFEAQIATIKQAGKGKEYDCVIGISGGADSTYNAVLAKEAGLRPLAVHLDNGWDAELAVCNIERTLKHLGIELHTHVIDWDEFRDLQLAYLRSGCVNIETLTDHAIWACLYHEAAKRDIKYICSGTNIVTEGILPVAWGYDNKDLVNILDIHKRFGSGIKLKTFPMLTFAQYTKYTMMKGIQYVSLLNYVTYRKKDIKPYLFREFGWKDYPGKHGESMFTYFYQSYMLPRRLHFGGMPVDKRKAHLSCLVCAGEMTRREALAELEKPLYKTENDARLALEYVAKKLNITPFELGVYIDMPVVPNTAYKTDENYNRAVKVVGRGKLVNFVGRNSLVKVAASILRRG
jgi:N-acetyl sugar amidotransferase